MKNLLNLFSSLKGGLFKIFMALMIGINIVALLPSHFTLAAGNGCMSSGPASGAYSVTVCITSPTDGATVSGSKNITATVTTTGSNPGVSKLIFYLSGEYLITDFQSTYTFVLPTTKWVDGSRLLEVEALMKDGFTSQRASITLNFNNGITQPPVNSKTFTPWSGTTPPSGQSFVVAATGDGADGATNAGNVTDLIASWNPNLFLYLGDVYEDGTATEFRNWYGTSSTFFGRFRSITNPVIGNHEYSAGGIAPGYFDYWDNVPRYYSYDAAGWHFIALDSNCGLVPVCGVGQAEYQWLLNDLNTHSNICTITYYHHPVFNVGPEGYSTKMNDIWALLAQYGVDIVLNGHDHNYQRWKPLDGNGNISATGITQFVAGGGGHGTQQFITTDSRLAVGFDTTPNAFGALRLQLSQYGAGYQYINTAGTILDSGSITCSGAPADTTAPSKPTNLQATASNPQLVQLTWTASIDNVGVTGYTIYRDGALLTTIGPAASYSDTTVTPGGTYSYQIQARDAAGNVSALSNTATVTTSLLLFSDGFESGDFSLWTSVNGLTIQQQQVYAGLYGVRGKSTGIPTYAYKQLSQSQNDLYYRLWFKILSQGTNSVYLQRFRTSSNGAIMGVFVSSTGKLAYRNDLTGITTTSTTTVTQGTWHELQVHVLINGTPGGTEVWLDGARINDLSKNENLGGAPIGRLQLGESSSGRTYDIALDRVALSTSFIDSSNPSEGGSLPTPTPTLPPTPTQTPVPTSSPPGIATLVSPTGDLGTNNSPSFTWNKISDSTWYYLWINGPSGKVLDKWYEASTICSASKCTVASPITLSSGNYTWWIQTWNVAGLGSWSSGMNFSIPTPPLPGKATLTSPTGDTGTNNPTYTWNEVSGATWYYLWVDGPSGNVLKIWYTSAQANCNGSTCSVAGATPNLTAGPYTWKVQTWNNGGLGPWSDPTTFSPALPGKATLVAPTGSGATNIPTYTWNEVSGATWYYLWVNDLAQPVIQQWYTAAEANCNGTTCSVTPSTILSSGAHTWWIQTWNAAGFGPWSTGMNFSVP